MAGLKAYEPTGNIRNSVSWICENFLGVATHLHYRLELVINKIIETIRVEQVMIEMVKVNIQIEFAMKRHKRSLVLRNH